MGNNWSERTSFSEVCRRAGGRRCYNSVRRMRREGRRLRLSRLLLRRRIGVFDWGWQTRLAMELGVHKSTICRDFRAIMAPGRLYPENPIMRSPSRG